MAKKDKKKVVVFQEYLDILIDKADMLTELFESEDGPEGAVMIAESDFKDYREVKKAFEKVDTTVENYDPPQEG